MTSKPLDVLIIGAGWAGLAAADVLAGVFEDVWVVEKGRGPGGRSATRRHEGWVFDHGAQYFTAYDAKFNQQIQAWSEAGLIQPWSACIETWGPRPDPSSALAGAQGPTRWVGVGGNNAVLRFLAERHRVSYQHRVEQLTFDGGLWSVQLSSPDGRVEVQCLSVLITAPPSQSADLIGPETPLYRILADHPMAPTWALMVGFGSPIERPYQAGFINQGALSWFAQQTSKPGSAKEGWVIHATPDWSEAHLEEREERVGESLYQQWMEVIGPIDQKPQFLKSHRWRYAQSRAPLALGFLKDSDRSVWVAGDWCCGNRVEGAWLSGHQAAQDLTIVRSR